MPVVSGLRPLMEEAYQSVFSSAAGELYRLPVVIAPTGYGKTMASPLMYRRAVRDGVASGLIHVVPLRILVRSIFMDHFMAYGGGYQMSSPMPDRFKSPYFMRPLVVSTIDSYLWNIYRVPVLEYANIEGGLSGGHYYPVLASILSSLNVFDEAHIYVGDPGVGAQAVYAALYFLAWTDTSALLESATLSPSMIAGLGSLFRGHRTSSGRRVTIDIVVPSCLLRDPTVGEALQRVIGPVSLRIVDESVEPTVGWRTRLYRDWSEAYHDIIDQAAIGRVLLVANTVERALKLYRDLEKTGMPVMLIHGRLADQDRKRAEELLRQLSHGIIVATQVAEVGVDVNSMAVYSDAAPLDSLVQRAGRACRRDDALRYCMSEAGTFAIIGGPEAAGPYSKDLVKMSLEIIKKHLHKGIDWRSLCPHNTVSYYTMLAKLHSTLYPHGLRLTLRGNILQGYLTSDGSPSALLRYLKNNRGMCGLYRDTTLIPLYTSRGFVTVTTRYLAKHTGLLQRCGNSFCLALFTYDTNGDNDNTRLILLGQAPAEKLTRYILRGRMGCELAMHVKDDIQAAIKKLGTERVSGPLRWALVAEKSRYVEGIGLV